MRHKIKEVDQPCWGLIQDLKRKGLFESTLVIWGGEFGRTIYSQGGLSKTNYGRDHHPRCFTMWMAGGGAKGGAIHGETDDFSYNIVKDPVHIHDFHATVLHLSLPGARSAPDRCREGPRDSGTGGLIVIGESGASATGCSLSSR